MASRTAASNRQEALVRLKTGAAYLDVAELVLNDRQRDEFFNVAGALAVLAGIAASDALCAIRLGKRHRGDDHRGATQLLESATPDGRDLANRLRRLLDLKDEAHYGVVVVSSQKARSAVRNARHLLRRATEELER